MLCFPATVSLLSLYLLNVTCLPGDEQTGSDILTLQRADAFYTDTTS